MPQRREPGDPRPPREPRNPHEARLSRQLDAILKTRGRLQASRHERILRESLELFKRSAKPEYYARRVDALFRSVISKISKVPPGPKAQVQPAVDSSRRKLLFLARALTHMRHEALIPIQRSLAVSAHDAVRAEAVNGLLHFRQTDLGTLAPIRSLLTSADPAWVKLGLHYVRTRAEGHKLFLEASREESGNPIRGATKHNPSHSFAPEVLSLLAHPQYPAFSMELHETLKSMEHPAVTEIIKHHGIPHVLKSSTYHRN